LFDRKKLLEERINAAVRVEFAALISELDRDLREYRRRSRLKEEAWAVLERAEAEVSKAHVRRITLKGRFWEAYYGEDEAALSEIERKHKRLERAIKKMEKFRKRARATFEKVDFDEVAEGAVLREKAHAAQEKADLRIDALEKAFEDLLAGVWRDVKKVSQALHDECEEPEGLEKPPASSTPPKRRPSRDPPRAFLVADVPEEAAGLLLRQRAKCPAGSTSSLALRPLWVCDPYLAMLHPHPGVG
jgi:tetratricopeptide (TPR) repeat protein